MTTQKLITLIKDQIEHQDSIVIHMQNFTAPAYRAQARAAAKEKKIWRDALATVEKLVDGRVE